MSSKYDNGNKGSNSNPRPIPVPSSRPSRDAERRYINEGTRIPAPKAVKHPVPGNKSEGGK